MKHCLKFAGAAILPLILAGSSLSQQSSFSREGDRWVAATSGTVAAARNLRIKTEFGNVRVQGGSRQDINYTFRNISNTSSEDRARRQLTSFKVNSYVRGDTAYIIAEDESGSSRSRCSGEFVVDVPRDTGVVKIETDGGSVVVTAINGRVDAETGGGSIKVDDIGGAVNVQTGGDYIDVGTVGGDVTLETGGGKITIRDAKGKISAQTGGGNIIIYSGQQTAIVEAGGGNIQVKQLAGKLKVSTGGGNVDLGDIGGPVEIETGGGSIRLSSAKGLVLAETGAGRIELNDVPAARAETGAGGIVARFIAAGGDRSDSSLETSAGDITVYLAPNLSISVRANIELANGHNISSDFPDIHVTSEGDWGARSISAEGSVNGGGPILKIRTTTGDIRILRASR